MIGPRISPPNSLHWLGLFLLVQALVFGSVGGYFGGKSIYLLSSGEIARGAVVGLDRGSKGSASPIVEFTTKTGQRVRFDGIISQGPPKYEIGDQVLVHYLPDRPSFAVIDTFGEMWLLPMIMAIALTLIGALGMMFTRMGLRRTKARTRARAGVHIPASVVDASPVRMKNSTQWEPIVQVLDPGTGMLVQCKGDQQRTRPIVGSTAVVHVESTPPHSYFVEMTS